MDYTFLLHKNGRGKHVLEVDNRLTNLQFFFLVNYLKFPQYIEYAPDIKGYTNVKDVTLFSEDELGNRIMVLMPEGDKDFDCVHVVTTAADLYKIDFKPKRTKLKRIKFFSEPVFNMDQVTHTQAVAIPEPLPDDYNPFVNHKSFEKRFYILAPLLLLLLYTSAHVLSSTTYDNYLVFVIMMPFVWLYFEHDYLFTTRHYIKFLVFSILLLVFGYFAVKENLVSDSFTFFTVLSCSFLFLIFQKLLSMLYISIFKKRPDFINESKSSKYFYEVPLFITTVFSSMFLYNVYSHLLE
nr:hypothetical protein [uncultured Psychroserpens sp.]